MFKAIGFLFILLLPSISLGQNWINTRIPVLHIDGTAMADNRIHASVDVLTTNREQKNCFVKTEYMGRQYSHARYYKLEAVTLSNYYGQYSVDIDLKDKILSALKSEILRGKLDIGELTLNEFYNQCGFEISQVNVNCENGMMVVRSSTRDYQDNIFEVERDATEIGYYALNSFIDRLHLTILFK